MAKATAEVMAEASKQLVQAQHFKGQLKQMYTTEESVSLYLSPMYRDYFGKVMRVMVNGISIYFKVDGSTQTIPTTFADEITRRRMAVDSMLTKQNRMADIQNNSEAAPGELTLF